MSKPGTIQWVEEKYNPEKISIKGFPADQEYPLPAGTGFFMYYMNFVDEPEPSEAIGWKKNYRKHGICGTEELDLADRNKAYARMRKYEFKHLHPKLGKSINKHSYPVGSVMDIVVKDEAGGKKIIPYLCECGGKFRRELSGDFYCDNCGIEYRWETDEENSRKTSFFDTLETDSFEETLMDESEAPQRTSFGLGSFYQGEETLGGIDAAGIRSIEDRLTRNIVAWKMQISDATEDEIRFKENLHKKVEATKKAKSKIRKDSVYNSRINQKKSDERRGLILFHLKNSQMNTAAKLAEYLGMHRTTVTRLLESLEQDNRVVSSKQGKERVYQYVKEE